MKALRIFLEITIGLLVLPFEAIRIIIKLKNKGYDRTNY